MPVTILVKNTSKACLQLSKMPTKRVKFSNYDKIASLIDSVFDSENDESDIDSDNESVDDNTTNNRLTKMVGDVLTVTVDNRFNQDVCDKSVQFIDDTNLNNSSTY
ncbi:hypothetical protein C0J52_26484 [Blattella germanica]|nr:hypothetical protein C0J52_26484 [Blattella germanica]